MKTATSKFIKFNKEILVLAAVISLAIILIPIKAQAQNCSLPSFPTASITTTQDPARMLCLLGLTFPILPARSRAAWPRNDPTAPPNTRPTPRATPEGTSTDHQG